MTDFKAYCSSLTRYTRFKTREVKIGEVPVGANNPIRIQSMTTTDTMDTIATVEQTIRMVESGCEYVRITAPSKNEADNLANIKDELRKRGYDVPLIADIHFTPNAAEIAARIVEKVRVNPGNYADKKKFQQIEYTDDDYQAELDRIYKRFSPLVKICKEEGTAMRIGTNHGSLSDRIMSRYGDTPLGMVESALEFVRICEDLNYRDLVLSMKASSAKVMVHAYRMMLQRMIEEGMDYPIHLGVTEAGDGEDGRVKSAVGIGALLEDGIGDTVRVSLTEEPENEAPVAIALVDRYKERGSVIAIPDLPYLPKDPCVYERTINCEAWNIGGKNLPVVVSDFSGKESIRLEDLESIGYIYFEDLDKWTLTDLASDYIYAGDNKVDFELPQNLGLILNYKSWLKSPGQNRYPFFSLDEFVTAEKKSDLINFVEVNTDDVFSESFGKIEGESSLVLILKTENPNAMQALRRVFFEFVLKGINHPVIVKREYENISTDSLFLYSSTDIGALLIDGFGDGVILRSSNMDNNEQIETLNRLSFGILQAARLRISKTEYIACPSCGRTLFDLVEVTNMIREKTGHLKGLKIGIMGCIVNGPGEMADADYGYVGVGPGKIALYRGKEVVRRDVSDENAVDELIALIKEDGNWKDKPN